MKTILTIAVGLLGEGVLCTLISEAAQSPSLRALGPLGIMLSISGVVLLILCAGAQFSVAKTSNSEPVSSGNELGQ